MQKQQSNRKTASHDHAFFLYSSDDKRLSLIAEYFKQGRAKNELCIFVTPELSDEVIQSFEAIDFGVSKATDEGSLRVFETNQIYLPNGRFTANHLLDTISASLKEAASHGFSGLRTAGEMSWLIDHPEAVDEAVAYEHRLNSVRSPSTNFAALCLYPVRDEFNSIVQDILQSHPSFSYDGTLQSNPYYKTATNAE